MIDIERWIKGFTERVNAVFESRVWFLGLQGSYARGEATDKSDIDVVVILDRVRIGDLQRYSGMLDGMPDRELVCGFISGKDELMNWTASELFQFYFDTVPLVGNLDGLLDRIDKRAVEQAIHGGACAIYHSCVHNFVHEKDTDILKSLYKSAVFVLQALFFYRTGKYIRSKAGLAEFADGEEKTVLETEQQFKSGSPVDFTRATDTLFTWSKKLIGEFCL